jgi:hypothetical protein
LVTLVVRSLKATQFEIENSGLRLRIKEITTLTNQGNEGRRYT